MVEDLIKVERYKSRFEEETLNHFKSYKGNKNYEYYLTGDKLFVWYDGIDIEKVLNFLKHIPRSEKLQPQIKEMPKKSGGTEKVIEISLHGALSYSIDNLF